MNESTSQVQECLLSALDRSGLKPQVSETRADCSRDDLREAIARNVMAWIGQEADEKSRRLVSLTAGSRFGSGNESNRDEWI
jgi:hypothetical protein